MNDYLLKTSDADVLSPSKNLKKTQKAGGGSTSTPTMNAGIPEDS